MDTIVEIRNLTKTYRRKIDKKTGLRSIFQKNDYEQVYALKGINISISRGEFVGFLGINGAGKSTTIKLLAGIMPPDEGSATINGLNTYSNIKKISPKIGILFGQRSSLVWDLPFIHSLELLKDVYSVSDTQYEESIELADRFFGIKSLLKVPVRTMSLGQRMKCEFTAILLHQPELYILDEPTIGLDIVTKKQINRFLSYLNLEYQATIFLTTHDIGVVEKSCKRIIVINNGEVLLDNATTEVVDHYPATFASLTAKDEDADIDFGQYREMIEVLNRDRNQWMIKINEKGDPAREILTFVMSSNELSGISIDKPDLESVLLYLYENQDMK
ncbi:ABC transporter ATP-binding protein [Paenibacillus typhae]|uniref:ABC transporter ATP-binding protein n=1 Tax=Paenibacillus typhae TaxID=1174501 RepID=UPI001C8D5496|nr:ATP-binding cassette domain-containing protein [Paenibacillus typhae]MBY0012092.1 ATP-binding cassette domain-containing protein [Paenibacillus typhae]